MTFPAEINLEDLDGTDGFSITGLVGGGFRFGDGLGSAVASLGDVNGDGFDDFIIGVPQADPGDPARENAGVSYVIFGRDTSVDGNFDADFSLSDLDGTNGFAINGAAAGDYLGASVAGVGDVNGDGIADIAVGAPGGDPGGREGAGETYIIFGKDTEADGDFAAAIKVFDLDGTDGFVINGVEGATPPPGDSSGQAVSSAGDVNGDGIDDILIGAPLADEPGSSIIGEAYVVFGKDTAEDGDFASSIELSSLDGTNGFTIPGLDFQDTAGSSVSGGGDINNDGVDDIVISAPRADNDDVSEGDEAGETYVIFGKDTSEDGDFDATVDLEALDGSNGFILTGTELADFSGFSVDFAGDINNDGIVDLLIGANRDDPDDDGSRDYAGVTYVVFGRDSTNGDDFEAKIPLSSLDGTNGFAIYGEVANDYSGTSVAGVGDVNGDGIYDILIGAPYATVDDEDYTGRAYIVFGKDSTSGDNFDAAIELSSLDGTDGVILNGAADDYIGEAVSSAGDLNGDNIPDFVVGGSKAADNAGRTYVIYGQMADPNTPPNARILQREFDEDQINDLGNSVVNYLLDRFVEDTDGDDVDILADTISFDEQASDLANLPDDFELDFDLLGSAGTRIRIATDQFDELGEGETATLVFNYDATDGEDTSNLTFTAIVNGVNDAPEVPADQQFSIDEGANAGDAVGTVAATDVDGGPLTFDVTGGNENGLFTIDEDTGEITAAQTLTDDTAGTYTLTVDVSDGLDSTTRNVCVVVNEVEPPDDAVVTVVNSWGFGAIIQIAYTLTPEDGENVSQWTFDIDQPDGTFVSGWLNGYADTVFFDAGEGIFTDQNSYPGEPSFGPGDTIIFNAQLNGLSGPIDVDAFEFDFEALNGTVVDGDDGDGGDNGDAGTGGGGGGSGGEGGDGSTDVGGGTGGTGGDGSTGGGDSSAFDNVTLSVQQLNSWSSGGTVEIYITNDGTTPLENLDDLVLEFLAGSEADVREGQVWGFDFVGNTFDVVPWSGKTERFDVPAGETVLLGGFVYDEVDPTSTVQLNGDDFNIV